MPHRFTLTPDGAFAAPSPVGTDARQPALHWRERLEAGRLAAAIGPRTRPGIVANRARADAILGAHAAALRAARSRTD
ncbi:hypothetical protein [Sphingomonas sp.]|uniref:hypothetical protein n=1 Tax=Sphingomonas sp. TaxID=28214 RepID=UPI001B2D65AB|nr:hypothetical protein [Sphingomonas sp.]MBO9715171.1 hypothetical protein [Sphingomonas sp.]